MSKVDYPSNWEDIRKRILIRDNYTCCDCKKYYGVKYKRFLHVHHVISLNNGGHSRPSNLLTLCYRCHKIKHPHMSTPENIKAYNKNKNKHRKVKQRKYR